ncbi:NBAS subunit of NRZ tethering complex isoform X2 [Stigmatopora nigra]
MAQDSLLEGEEENILYDLLVINEWPPETDTQVRGQKDQNTSLVAKTLTGPFRLILQYLWYSPSSSSLPPALLHLVNKQMGWQLALASNGKLLAVVQDQCVEIRSARDEFGSVVGKCQVPKDPNPQWRGVAWSHHCALLAFADSTGTVRLFDLVGSELFVIPPAPSFPGDFSSAVAGLIFLEYTGSAQWSAELLVITFGGGLKSYLVSVGTTQNVQENHTFSFSAHHPHGVTAAVYHPGHRLLLVAGRPTGDDGGSEAGSCGLSAWRALSASPHYKQVTGYQDDVHPSQKRNFLRMPGLRLFGRRGDEKDGVFRMSLSPDGTLLAVVHFSGRLSLWDVPSLRRRAAWEPEQQPGFEELNPEWKSSLEKRKKIKDKERYRPLVDVNWWSQNALILARCSGALAVSSVRDLRNLLGKSCEWLETSPRVTAAHDGGFLSLECEVKLAQKRGRPESHPGEEDEDGGDDSDSDDESSAKARYFGYLKRGLYFVTEMERFAPPRKRPRTVLKNYRLISLRSTTPEELYQRKIDNEEYGEALSLARAYDLDSDLVYQRQWRKSAVSVASIQDYLSKIRKRSWVLHECVERVPENVDAAKELLQYGLKGTQPEALLAIGKGEDAGRFVAPGDLDLDDAPYQDLSEDEELRVEAEREAGRRRELLAMLDFGSLTLEQKELCRNRLKLLSYLDRLATYEEILGGPHAAEQKYDARFFKTFRSQNIVLSARNYARESNVQALDILFTYHGAQLLPHRLAILSNFPETTSPHEYTVLLPEACVDERGERSLIAWDERRHRESDWCESERCRAASGQEPSEDDAPLYEDAPELLRFRGAAPSANLLSDWYCSRAGEIESCSRQVDCALSLVRLGTERDIPGLEALCDDLVTMETLVYETRRHPGLTLLELRRMEPIDKLRLLMDQSSQERYAKDAFQWMLPFLHRCERREAGAAARLLCHFLLDAARRDLALPLIIFQHSKPACPQKVIGDADQLMLVALECVYGCERDDQLGLCYDVLECLPQRGFGPETDLTSSLHDRVDRLEKHLSVAEVLEKHGLRKPISYVRKSEKSPEEGRQLMVKLCRHTGRKTPPASESAWKALLQDLLDMQRNVYTCLRPHTCHQIFVESLLCSSRVENVRLAGQLMRRSQGGHDGPASPSFLGKGPPVEVAYDKSVELVLAAAREYFNSSTAPADPCMALGRCCLQLISERPPAVREELDLIDAVALLGDFGVNILPLQVRLRWERLSLVEEVVSCCPSAYKRATTLLSLAALLRVAGDDEGARKGQVLTLLAQQALHAPDFKASYVHCQDLMAAGYAPAWDVCSRLGRCEELADWEGRRQLLAFSMAHCPPDRIQTLLAASVDLRTRVLYRAVGCQMDVGEGEGKGVDASDSAPMAPPGDHPPGHLLQRTTAKTMEVLATTGTTTKAVLSALGDHRWWKQSLRYLRPPHDGDAQEASGQNSEMERQGCCAFYRDLLENPYVDPSQDAYWSAKDVPPETFAQALLRTGKLAEAKTEGSHVFPATEVLLQLADEAFPRDAALALSYLLALPQVLDANRCLERRCHSALSLQLAAYYYALQIYARLRPRFQDRAHALYQADPKELIRVVGEHASAYSGWPEDVRELASRLRHYRRRLCDLTQARVLRGLGRGVDARRFAADPQYKKETILGLAETLDDTVYDIAESLAKRYGVPQWELHMTHLEFLFTDSGLSIKEVESRSQSLGLLTSLKSDPRAFHEHMSKYVLPGVEGGDLERLLYYYTLLDAAGCRAQAPPGAIPPGDHVKLLKKLRAVAAGINYRQLTDASRDPLAALEPVLNSQNVLSVSKLANLLPRPGERRNDGGGQGGDGSSEGATLTASAVHAAWLKKLFWKGDGQLLKKTPRDDQDFLHAFDACAKYLERLTPTDAVDFLDDVTFSAEAVAQLSIEARSELLRRAGGALRQLADKSKKRGGGHPPAWEEARARLCPWQAHLDTLTHSFIVELRQSQQERERGYARLYDLSRSEEPALRRLAVSMATDGRPLADIRRLLSVAAGSPDLCVKGVLREAVDAALSDLRFSGDRDTSPALAVLESVAAAVQADTQAGDGSVSPDELLEWLRAFCGDDSLATGLRVAVLQILESNFSVRDADVGLLLLYRTRAVLKHTQVQMEDVEDEDKRRHLFLQLLEAARRPSDFQTLNLLLRAWPPFARQDGADGEGNPWVLLISTMLTGQRPAAQDEAEPEADLARRVLDTVRGLYPTKHKLSPQCVGSVARLMRPDFWRAALKLTAESGDQHLLGWTLDAVNDMTPEAAQSCDHELLSLLLDAGLLAGCVASPAYPPLRAHLLSRRDADPDPGTPGRQAEAGAALAAAGHRAEAGALLLAARGAHPACVTFDSAFAVLDKWL